jgi:hypothetical protein
VAQRIRDVRERESELVKRRERERGAENQRYERESGVEV